MPGATVTEEDVIALRQNYRGALLVTEGGRAFEVAALDARLAGRSLPAQIFFYCGAPHWKLHLLLHDASANMPALQRAVAAWLEKAQQDPECPELLRPLDARTTCHGAKNPADVFTLLGIGSAQLDAFPSLGTAQLVLSEALFV